MGDFALQSDRLVQAKKTFRLGAYLRHAVLQAALAYAFAGLWLIWEIPVAIGLSHCVIDFFKELAMRLVAPKNEFGKTPAAWKFWSLVVDQVAHLGVIGLVIWHLTPTGRIPVETYWSLLIGSALWRKSLVIWIGILATVYVGGVLIGILVEPFLAELRGPDGNLKPEKRGLENGGRRIGQIERALILLLVLSAQPASVGFLVTAKSVFRFGELKNGEGRKEAEYIIIGTMLSFTWALALAWAIQYALQNV
jgi:hypothetical protein